MSVGWECKWGWRPVCKCGPSLNTTATAHYPSLLRLFACIKEVQPCLLTNDNVMIRVFVMKPSQGMTFTQPVTSEGLHHPNAQVNPRIHLMHLFICRTPAWLKILMYVYSSDPGANKWSCVLFSSCSELFSNPLPVQKTGKNICMLVYLELENLLFTPHLSF